LGYGRIPGVITGLELDALLREDKFAVEQGEREIRSVAFIQCVGSRDPKIGRNYCSRVCCGYALRLARLLRHRFPKVEPSMFYMDIQTFDRDFERRLDQARREVRLIRAMPAEVRAGVDGRTEIIYQGPDDERVVESFDLVSLSIGMSPEQGLVAMAELFDVEPDEFGFLGPNSEQVATGKNGVFLAGAVQGPMSIEETTHQATRAAGAVASYLAGTRRGEET
jgi:heterodisulfide reductase subunit A